MEKYELIGLGLMIFMVLSALVEIYIINKTVSFPEARKVLKQGAYLVNIILFILGFVIYTGYFYN